MRSTVPRRRSRSRIRGPGFDPRTIPDPTEDENIEIPSGRGVMLIKAYMTDVEFVKPGNKLRMRYAKQAAADAS